jgi:hypothetical protein
LSINNQIRRYYFCFRRRRRRRRRSIEIKTTTAYTQK